MRTNKSSTKKRSNKPKKAPITATRLSKNLIISVGEARKVLGSVTNSMSDDEFEDLIFVLTDISQDILKQTPTSKVQG